MRDPAGNVTRYEQLFDSDRRVRQLVDDGDATRTLERQVWVASNRCGDDQKLLRSKFGFGLPMHQLAEQAAVDVAQMAERMRFVHQHGPAFDAAWRQVLPLKGVHRDGLAFAAIALATLPRAEDATALAALVARQSEFSSNLFDLLLMAFAPGAALLKKYKADKYQAPWIDPVLRAIAQPEERRAEALAAHMKNWCRIMRPWGWKPKLDTAPGKDALFCDFAFEVALAVCAYDIDDSTFRSHPYYPRDLVDHYRAHIRHTRDGWRAERAGPGVAVIAPPPAPNADLGKSKRKAFARWVELVCDGNVDATESVFETIGKPRKIKDLGALMEALAADGQGIHADLKDDETVELSCIGLAGARALGEFEGPPGPPFGPARCSAVLLAFSDWAAQRGYRMVALDNEEDAWCAVLVRAAYHQEFIELGNTLGLAAQDPAHAWRD